VPAIYGDPEKTWTPKPKYGQVDLGAHPRPSQIHIELMKMTPLTPTYSSNPRKTSTSWSGRDRTEPAWITRGIRTQKPLQKARVLLYDHGVPEENHTLKLLASRLLQSIEDLRRKEVCKGGTYYNVGEMLGGLVLKFSSG
jgi:hypothetical protein